MLLNFTLYCTQIDYQSKPSSDISSSLVILREASSVILYTNNIKQISITIAYTYNTIII